MVSEWVDVASGRGEGVSLECLISCVSLHDYISFRLTPCVSLFLSASLCALAAMSVLLLWWLPALQCSAHDGPLLCRYSCTGPTAIPVQGPLLFLCRAHRYSCTGPTAIPVQGPPLFLCRATAVPLFLYRATAVPLFLYRAHCYSCTGPTAVPQSFTGPTAVPLFLYRALCCAAIPVQGPLLFLYRAHCCAAIPVQGPLLFLYRAHCCAAIPVQGPR